MRHWFSLAVPGLIVAVAACTTSASDGPQPADPVVYDASAETRAATGIATWGYGTDNAGTTIFHGYDAHNAQIVELAHVFQITGGLTRRFALTMSGPQVSGAVHIEYESIWDDTTQTAQYVAHLLDNTIPSDGLGARILQRVTPDAKTIPANAAASTLHTSSLPVTLQPLDSPVLVDGNGDLVTCCCQLQNDGAVLAASTVSECGQVGAVNSAGTKTSDLHALDLVGGAPPQDLVVGANGTPEVNSPWVPPYNIVDNNCHDAAAANVSKTDGYVACGPLSSTTSWGGHTVNWAPDPTKKDDPKAFCIYEPQYGGLTLVDGAACCWEGPAASSGVPDLTTADAGKCAKQFCGDQYVPPVDVDGGTDGATKAMPAGQKPQVARDCPSTTDSAVSCNACCTSVADDVLTHFSDDETKQWVSDYRPRCATSCSDRYLVTAAPTSLASKSFAPSLRPADLTGPVDAAATRCLASGLAANNALAEARAACGLE